MESRFFFFNKIIRKCKSAGMENGKVLERLVCVPCISRPGQGSSVRLSITRCWRSSDMPWRPTVDKEYSPGKTRPSVLPKRI